MRLIPAALYLARGGLTFADIREVFPPAKAIADHELDVAQHSTMIRVPHAVRKWKERPAVRGDRQGETLRQTGRDSAAGV
ncbi:hypothetical protein thsrh120_39070 [Rhizobium sp. No.120]